MHVRIRQDLPDNQDIFAFPEERQKAQSLSLGEEPLFLDTVKVARAGSTTNNISLPLYADYVFSAYSVSMKVRH